MNTTTKLLLSGSLIAMAAATDTATIGDNASNTALLALADKIASQFDASDGSAEIENIVKAQEIGKRGPIAVLYDVILPEFGDLDEAGFPRVYLGDKKDESPDLVKVDRPGVNGSTRSVETSWYSELAKRTTAGRQDTFILGQCNLALNDKTEAQAEELYREMGRDRLLATKAACEQRITNRGKLWRKAAQVFFQMKDISSKLAGKVVVSFVTNADPKDPEARPALDRSAKSVFIADAITPVNCQAMTADAFINLDVNKALANGGGYKALKDTAKRDGTGGQAGSSTQMVSSIASVDKFGEYAAEMARYVGGDDADPKRVEAILNKCQKDEAYAKSLGDTCMALDGLWEQLKPRYQAINASIRRAKDAELAAASKKTA